MKREIIFQKKYFDPPLPMNSKIVCMDTNISQDLKNVSNDNIQRKRNFIWRWFQKFKTKQFIKKAIYVAELYNLDILITQETWGTTIELSFDSSGFLSQLKDVIYMADQIAFSAGIHEREITVLLNLNS